MKLSGCPVFTVKSLAVSVLVVGGVYFLYKMTTSSKKEDK